MQEQNSETRNVRYIEGPYAGVIRDSDDILNIDTGSGAVTLYLPNIKNSNITERDIYINDTGGVAATNNITISSSGEDLVNSASTVILIVNGASAKCSIANMNEWVVTGFGVNDDSGGSITPDVDYLDPAISFTNTPAVGPTLGDRYLINTAPTGIWASHANEVAEWDGVAWTYYVPVADDVIFITDTLNTYRFNGTSWAIYAGNAILQNGNSFGISGVRIGSNDVGVVWLKYNNTLRVRIDGSDMRTSGSLYLGIPNMTSAATARLHVRGEGNTSATYAVKIDNSDVTPLFYIQNNGNVGIGTSGSINARVSIISMTEQLRVGYDDSNYWNAITDNVGVTTFLSIGSSQKFVFGSNISNIQPDSQFNVGLDGITTKISIANGSKQVYIRNNGSNLFGIDAYDYGTNVALDFFLSPSGQKTSIGAAADMTGYIGLRLGHNMFSAIDSSLTVSLDGSGANFFRDANTANIFFSTYADNTNGSIMSFKKSRGIKAAPTTILNGDTLGELVAYPYDGTNYFTSGRIYFISNGTVALGSIPTDIVFELSGVEKMRLKNSGTLNASGLQIGNAGLSQYDEYVDTAANILANGDLIVGRKA